MPEEDPRIVELRSMREKSRQGGGAERIAKQHAKHKLTARERIDLLLDPGTFHETEPFVTMRDDETNPSEKTPGDGVVTGFGNVEGRLVYAYAQDFTVQGGALGEMQSHKICRVMDLAVQSGAPIIGMIDSGGARIQEGVLSLGGYAEIFKRNAQYSGIVPQISLILGPCAGGAAYSPALTDMIIMVEKQSYMFLTGPEVIKSVTGEIVDFETLGGAETHLSISGLATLTADSEKNAIALTRRVLSYLPANNVDNPPAVASDDSPTRMDEELNHLVPIDPYMPYSMHEAIEHIVDKGSFLELQSTFARNAIVGLARMGGMSVGIISQEPSVMAGSIDLDAADKITRFVRFCDSFNIPLVTFVDSPGFLPGVDQEHRGIIRHGAKVLYAYSEASVPKISIVTRKAYGGAYVVMSSKYLGTDINYAWPSAEIAVMGPEGAANILYRKQIEAAADPAAERARLTAEYREKFLNPYASASKGYVDDVIEPRETRARVIAALLALRDKSVSALARKHGNMPV
ncbi:propionyl-CoA carboxylase carboxyltransferase subunit [Longilinea arvoryzae]|uniref:Propionyl-CoA carboxylase carboxyltransferase subunit n=1 Tax=Longilinea arvoryzae TaxID=360412 RepID=A0A0S7BMA7_9CHLR|nr:acyl-CoA carboxylase subunit beta [Longilinea arvoryzae]GAP15654.1 propionyl-CoA carboxylase carboxyltransferase subunit [Longilinea arvoryzae]